MPNLANGDINSYAKEILLICSIIFARWQHASRGWSHRVHLGPPFWGKGRSYIVGVSDRIPFEIAMLVSYIGSPVRPFRYL